MGGRWTRRLESVTFGGAANPTVNAGGEASAKAGEKEGGKRPLLFGDGIEVGGWGGGKVYGKRVRVVSTSFTSSVSLARSHRKR